MAHGQHMPDTEKGVVLHELRAVGIKPTNVEETGGGHYKIRWQVPDKEPRLITVAGTGSDWRGKLNTRAMVRAMLKSDNLTLRDTVKRTGPKTALGRALAVPTSTPSLADLVEHVVSLRAELSDLTAFILEKFAYVPSLIPEPQVPEQPAPLKIGKKDMRPIIDHMSFQWMSIADIAKEAGMSERVAINKLNTLLAKSLVEKQGFHKGCRFRKKPLETNGHAMENGALDLWRERPEAALT